MRISFFSCSLESFFRPASAIFLHTEQRQRRRQDGASSSSHEPDDIWNANSSNCEIELNTTSYDGAWQSLFSFWMNRISLSSQPSDEGFRNVLNTAIHAHTHTNSIDLSFHYDGRTVNDLAICFENYFLNAYRQLVFPLLPFRFVARLGNRLRAQRVKQFRLSAGSEQHQQQQRQPKVFHHEMDFYLVGILIIELPLNVCVMRWLRRKISTNCKFFFEWLTFRGSEDVGMA